MLALPHLYEHQGVRDVVQGALANQVLLQLNGRLILEQRLRAMHYSQQLRAHRESVWTLHAINC